MAQWIIDSDHSCAAFAIRHMMLANVRGQFNMKGTIDFDPGDASRAAVEVEIDVASVNTGIRKRDEHLLTGDFLDQPAYPRITFKSTRVDFLNNNRCRATGDLGLHGVTKEVTLEGDFAGPLVSAYGGETSIGFSGTVSVNREDFGIMWGSEPLEGGGLVAGTEVRIFLEIEADLAE